MPVDPNADHIISSVDSTYVMTVPVGTYPGKFSKTGFPLELADREKIPAPDVQHPYDILYICTGLIVFEFRPTDDHHERIGVLTEHGPLEVPGVPIRDINRIPLNRTSPNDKKSLMVIKDYAVTVSLARINNFSGDNGIWSVDKAELKLPLSSPEPELSIQLTVSGNDTDEIKFERVSYTAFIQMGPVT